MSQISQLCVWIGLLHTGWKNLFYNNSLHSDMQYYVIKAAFFKSQEKSTNRHGNFEIVTFSLLCSGCFLLYFPPHVALTHPSRAITWSESAVFACKDPAQAKDKTKHCNTPGFTPRAAAADSTGIARKATCNAGDSTSSFLFYAVSSDTSLTQFIAHKPSNWAISRSATEFSLPRPCSPVKTVYWFLYVQRNISTH